jgi:hypothetical protein
MREKSEQLRNEIGELRMQAEMEERREQLDRALEGNWQNEVEKRRAPESMEGSSTVVAA